MALVTIHQKFRLDFHLLDSVTFSEIYLMKVVMVIKGGNRRHFCLLFWTCSSFSSIFFHCPEFSYHPSVSNSFSVTSFFLSLRTSFLSSFQFSLLFLCTFLSLFLYLFSFIHFFKIYILLLLLRLSFLYAVHPVDGVARSSPAWGSSPFWRAGVPAGGRGTAMSRVQGHFGSERAGTTRSFHAEGEWWAVNQAINCSSCKCVALSLVTMRRIVSLNNSFVKYVFRRGKLKLIIPLNAFEITFSY